MNFFGGEGGLEDSERCLLLGLQAKGDEKRQGEGGGS